MALTATIIIPVPVELASQHYRWAKLGVFFNLKQNHTARQFP